MIGAGREFIDGKDELCTFRQLYVAEKLLRHKLALNTVIDIMQVAPDGVEAALDAPTSTMAIVADEVREVRARAMEVGGTANIPDLPRTTRSTVLRGRIEDNAGLAYYLAGKTQESLTHFRRAVSVLPETTTWGRTAYWHLGDALRNSGNEADALTNYLIAYDVASPDPIKRAVIQTLYKKVNGSLDGLDQMIGPAVIYASRGEPKTGQAAPAPDNSPLQPASTVPARPEAKSVTTEAGNTGTPSDSKAAAADIPPATAASKDAPKSNPAESKPATPDQPKSDEGEVKTAAQDQKKADQSETSPTTPESTKSDTSEPKPSTDNPKSEPSTPDSTEKAKPVTPDQPKSEEGEVKPAAQDQKKAAQGESSPTTPDSTKTDAVEPKPSTDNPKS